MGEAKRRRLEDKPAPVKRNKQGPRWGLTGGLAVALLAVGVYMATRPPGPGSEDLPVADDNAEAFPAHVDHLGVSVGNPDASVVVREFADYQCPACARFATASRQLKQTYVDPGKVRFVFFDMPLRQHGNAMPAALAARCAGDQDSYWEMQGMLFDRQADWSSQDGTTEIFTGYAGELSLDEQRFRRCLSTELHREAVEESAALAARLQVTSTPTVLVNNVQLTRPAWGQLSAVVERELEESAGN